MSIDPAIKRIVKRIAEADRERFISKDGTINTEEQSVFVLDALEERHEDVLHLLENESPLWVIEQILKEISRKSRASIKSQYAGMISDEDAALQPKLPDLEKIRNVEISVHKGGDRYDRKMLLSCTVSELDIVDQGYGGLIETMEKHQQYVRVLASRARSLGFKETDTVRDLYRKSS